MTPSDELRYTMETCYAILEKRRVAAQNCGEVHGCRSNHRQHTSRKYSAKRLGSNLCEHTFPISSRSLTETRAWQGTSSGVFRGLSAEQGPTGFQSLSAGGGAEDAAVLRSLADQEDAEVSVQGSSLAPDEDGDTEEIYALLEQVDENLRYGALWAARLGLQQAMQRLDL